MSTSRGRYWGAVVSARVMVADLSELARERLGVCCGMLGVELHCDTLSRSAMHEVFRVFITNGTLTC